MKYFLGIQIGQSLGRISLRRSMLMVFLKIQHDKQVILMVLNEKLQVYDDAQKKKINKWNRKMTIPQSRKLISSLIYLNRRSDYQSTFWGSWMKQTKTHFVAEVRTSRDLKGSKNHNIELKRKQIPSLFDLRHFRLHFPPSNSCHLWSSKNKKVIHWCSRFGLWNGLTLIATDANTNKQQH